MGYGLNLNLFIKDLYIVSKLAGYDGKIFQIKGAPIVHESHLGDLERLKGGCQEVGLKPLLVRHFLPLELIPVLDSHLVGAYITQGHTLHSLKRLNKNADTFYLNAQCIVYIFLKTIFFLSLRSLQLSWIFS